MRVPRAGSASAQPTVAAPTKPRCRVISSQLLQCAQCQYRNVRRRAAVAQSLARPSYLRASRTWLRTVGGFSFTGQFTQVEVRLTFHRPYLLKHSVDRVTIYKT